MNLLLTLSNFLFPLITFPYISRVLNPIGTGKVAFAYSIVSYFSIFAAFGVANYGIRACAKVRDNKELLSKTVHEILAINFLLMVIVYIVYFLGIIFIDEMRNEVELFLILGLHILFTILGVEWLYKGLEQYSYITVRSIIFKLFSFFLIFIFVQDAQDYTIYAFILIFATVGSGIINIYNLKNIIYLKRFSNYDLRKHIRSMSIFFFTTIAVAFYVNVSVTVLGFLQGNEEVGYYNAAYRIKDIMVGVITSLGAVLLPRLSYYIENNKYDEFNRVLSKSMQFIFLFSLPLVAFCILFAEPSVLLLAGNAYIGAILPLQILSIIIFIVGVSNLTGIQMLIPLKMEDKLCYSVMIAAIVNMLLNFILIPGYGAVGSAISVAIAEICIVLYQIYVLRKYFYILFGSLSYIKLFFSLIFSILGVFLINYVIPSNEVLFFIVKSSVFFISYFTCLLLLKESFLVSVLKQLQLKIKSKPIGG